MKNELLCPAGSFEAVRVAIDNGADAVYCAGKRFGARALIANLSKEEIVEASHYVHLRGKKIYITLNTLVMQEELEEAFSYIDFLYEHVDAIIVQDYGIVHYIRSRYPDFPVHLSTQTSIHNKDDILFLKRLGISRIILAREVSLEEIKAMERLGVDIEIFIHGALCFCYSGLCYLSYYKGGRSGNRGSCAQPCRQEYTLLEDGKPIKEGPLLSMKDLNTIAKIREILDVGVSSLKIEGRAKSLEYLASVTRVYRLLIDEYEAGEPLSVPAKMLDDLYASFSRERTSGHLFAQSNELLTTDISVKHTGIEIGKVVGYRKGQATIRLSGELEINDGIRLVDGDKEIGSVVTRIIEKGNLVKSSKGMVNVDIKDYVAPGALVYKTSPARVHDSLKTYKAGSTNKARMKIEVNKDEVKLAIEVGDIALDKAFPCLLEPSRNDFSSKVIAQFTKTNNLPIEYLDVEYRNEDNLYLPIPFINSMRQEMLDELKMRLERRLTRTYKPYDLVKDNFSNVRAMDELTIDVNQEKGLINSKALKPSPIAYHLGELTSSSVLSPYFGVSNSYAVSFFRNFTKGVIVLSYESNLENATALSKLDKSLGYLVEFEEPLMVAKHCVVAKAKGFKGKHCGSCLKHQYQLKDKGDVYNLRFHDCTMFIKGKTILRQGADGLIDVVIK